MQERRLENCRELDDPETVEDKAPEGRERYCGGMLPAPAEGLVAFAT